MTRDPSRAGRLARRVGWGFFLLLNLLIAALIARAAFYRPVRVGSKSFTESVILGEMAVLLAGESGVAVEHYADLGGTMILWKSLAGGELDIYPEYTGTIRQEIFGGEDLPDLDSIRRRMAEHGVGMTEPIGFANNYSLGMNRDVASRLRIRTFSDLKKHPELSFGFSSEFLEREDGWLGLNRRYQFPQKTVVGMQHTLAYKAVKDANLDVTDVYTTDGTIEKFNLVVLEDDLRHFPSYDAVFLYRNDLQTRAPELHAALHRLEGRIDNETMRELNALVDVDRHLERPTAAEFLSSRLNVDALDARQARAVDAEIRVAAARFEVAASSRAVPPWSEKVANTMSRVGIATLEHLLLVVISLTFAILVSVPLGVFSAKYPTPGFFIVGTAEIIQTIPGLALLVLLASGFDPLNLPTYGRFPAICALFLYSLLPIMRNTMAGVAGVPNNLRESAAALGLAPFARMRLVELPMASPVILTGIKTTAVINVGYAALGGLIGAGGYGQVIMSGLRKFDVGLMLEGAIPAALLAIGVKWLFELAELYLVPKGLRLKGKT